MGNGYMVFVVIFFLFCSEYALGNIFVLTKSTAFSAASIVEDNLQDYGYTAVSPLVFDIRICGGAYVFLSSSARLYYVIMIHGKVNSQTKSAIYLNGNQGLSSKTERNEHALTLSQCRGIRKFRVSWGGTEIKLERFKHCSTWELHLSVVRETGIAESDITDIGLQSSNIYSNVDSYWKIDTQDNTLRLKTPNPNVMNDLQTYGYRVLTSTYIELNLKTCEVVYVKFYSLDPVTLAEVDIRESEVLVKIPSGEVSSISYAGIFSSCNLLKTYTMKWTVNSFHLDFQSGSFQYTLNVSVTGTKTIGRIGFTGPKSVVWNWKTDAPGSCFYVNCGPSCFIRPSTQSTTAIQLSSAEESTTTTDEIRSTALQYSTTDQPFTYSTTDQHFTAAKNACCCVPHSLLVAPLKVFIPPVVNKKDTNRHKRSLTSANDERPSSKYIGYAGSGFLLFIFIGVVIIDIPNLLNMVKIMKKNISSRFCTKRRITPINVQS